MCWEPTPRRRVAVSATAAREDRPARKPAKSVERPARKPATRARARSKAE